MLSSTNIIMRSLLPNERSLCHLPKFSRCIAAEAAYSQNISESPAYQWNYGEKLKFLLYCLHLPPETSPENCHWTLPYMPYDNPDCRCCSIMSFMTQYPLLPRLSTMASVTSSLGLATARVWSATWDTCQCFILYVYNAMWGLYWQYAAKVRVTVSIDK